MVDHNKIADNFFLLLDNFEAKKPENQNEDGNRDTSKEENNVTKYNKEYAQAGDGRKYTGRLMRHHDGRFNQSNDKERLVDDENRSKESNLDLQNHENKINIGLPQERDFSKEFNRSGIYRHESDFGITRSGLGRRTNVGGIHNKRENDLERQNFKIEHRKFTTKSNKMMEHKFLESLLDSETSFIITTLASPRSGFQELLNHQPLRSDSLMLIIKVLDKINQCEAHQLKLQIFSTVFRPEFIDEIKKFVSLACAEDNCKKIVAMSTFFKNAINVFNTVVNIFPSIMNEKLKSTLIALNLSMTSLKDENGIDVSDQHFVQLKDLIDQVNSYIEHKNKIDKEQSHVDKKDVLPPSNYREIPLVPTQKDFMTDQAFLRQNIVKGSYSNVDHYLDVQFRLLREDFIAPLREGIFEYIDSLSAPHLKRKYSNVRIYPKVKFGNPFKSRDVYGFCIQFDCEKKLPHSINWEYNKRFMPGSLLLFSDNDFKTFYLATVVERNIQQLQEGSLFVTLVPGTDVPEYAFDPGVYFVMAESEVYYEAYKPVLSALQRMNERNFPMKQYIVDVDTACFPPAYLVDNSVYKISTYDVALLDENSWPCPEQLKLNPSQHRALKSALTNDFVVIQGPPGTGKTFLALTITEILLKNDVSKNTPIVVICYTNHALDQFLEGILKYTNDLIRIGMQSQNEALRQFNLEEVRKQMKDSRSLNSSALFKETMCKKYDVQSKLEMVNEKIEKLSNPKGILDLSVLKSVVPEKQYDELVGDEENWLFCYDNPEFRTMEKSFGILAEMPREMFSDHSEGNHENISELLVGDFEEVDEEESARRFADMTEDDFFEENFVQEDNYVCSLIYCLTLNEIEVGIESANFEMSETQYSNRRAKYYFERKLKERIKELIWKKDFLKEYLYRFKSFKFSAERFMMFKQNNSVWEMNVNDRWEYYWTWVHLYICHLKQVVQHLTKDYQDTIIQLHELRQLEDLKFVQSASVVGLTTSGAAKRRVLLESLGTKIVIVEEAAEVLESHIVTSLAQSVQHVILIGDHKQLKPNPAVFKLAKKYNMDCSLFERMIRNGLGCSVLNEQHRMRPEIASLITPTIYTHLINHPSTMDRPKIRGIDKFVFFLTHNQPEDQLPDSSSKQNKYEADILMALCQYLLLNGYKADEITILATYAGQVWYMRKKRREMGFSCPEIRAVRITPVDNFQGEENRIILLSLVRSNSENRIGFLSTENRVCVALSRAKEGLYIVGNMDNLTNSSTIWPRIKLQLEAINAVGPKLTVRCERHPDQMTQVSQVKDFKAMPEGGCSLKCETQLNCGHICPRICHIIDKDHDFYKCQQKCERPPCPVEDHKCPLRCGQTCEPCIILVQKELPCGHTATLRCHEEPASHKCLEKVPAVHPACQHEIFKACFMDVEKCSCSNPCSSRLPCGHACERKCHVWVDPDHLEYECKKECVKEYKGCPRQEHPCPKLCFEECEPCQVLVQTILPCGHCYNIPCSVDPTTFSCERTCEKIMTCGHKCKLECWLPCEPNECVELVDKEAPCGHKMERMKCNEPTERRKCLKPCLCKLECGHPCTDKCFKDCSNVLCQELVDSRVAPACKHSKIKIPCHLNKAGLHGGSDELVQLCDKPCGKNMSCGHECKGTCGMCMQGRLHVPCDEKCSNILFCGHKCTAVCSKLCPPCVSKKCLTRCSHRACLTKYTRNHECFTLCDPCNKPCVWICVHHQCRKKCGEDCDRPLCYEPCPEKLDCGHDCIGFCGETCPPLCAVCNEDDPAIRDNPTARYVELEDCKHIIESEVLEKLVSDTTKDNTFRLMKCPLSDCSKAVVNTLRFRNVYFGFRRQVAKIDTIVGADEVARLLKVHTRHSRLLASEPTVSHTMNQLMTTCSMPFKNRNNKNPNKRYNLGNAELERLIVGCLLYPLAENCEKLKRTESWYLDGLNKLSGSVQRLKLRLDYLANALLWRMDQISYQTVQQIELVIAHILRVTLKRLPLSWYDVTPYTWQLDRQMIAIYNLEPVTKLSATLRTRDSSKQWFLCNNQHLFVTENETCVTCMDEVEETHRMKEEVKQRLKQQKAQESQSKWSSSRLRHDGKIPVTEYRKINYGGKGGNISNQQQHNWGNRRGGSHAGGWNRAGSHGEGGNFAGGQGGGRNYGEGQWKERNYGGGQGEGGNLDGGQDGGRNYGKGQWKERNYGGGQGEGGNFDGGQGGGRNFGKSQWKERNYGGGQGEGGNLDGGQDGGRNYGKGQWIERNYGGGQGEGGNFDGGQGGGRNFGKGQWKDGNHGGGLGERRKL